MLARILGNLLPLLELIPSRSTIKPSVGMSECCKMMSEEQSMPNGTYLQNTRYRQIYPDVSISSSYMCSQQVQSRKEEKLPTKTVLHS